MKNTIKLFGLIALVAVIGFWVTACEPEPEDPLNGTWINSEDNSSKMVLNNGSITISTDNVEAVKGTYSTSGNNITITITQINGAMLGDFAAMMGISPTKWYTIQELKEAFIDAIVAMSEGLISRPLAEAMVDEQMESYGFGELTGTYTLSGNTLSITMDGETTTFTKQ